MKLEKPINPNYAVTVVELTKIIPHPNANNLELAIIFGNSIAVSKGTPIGTKGLFFPLECQIAEEYLRVNNLFRDPLRNKDTSKKGFFEDSRRVKALRLRSVPSEGFFMPMDSLYPLLDKKIVDEGFNVGDEFDKINGNVLCQKYIIKVLNTPSQGGGKKGDKKPIPRESRLVDGQFRLHVDTAHLKKEMWKVNPEDIVSLTSKWHGTSWVAGRVLEKKRLGWFKKLLNLAVKLPEVAYGLIYSSRKVIKNKFFEDQKNNPNHFYGYDLWKEIAESLEPFIPDGITLYGEAVGFLKDGKAIQAVKQGPYHYGQASNTYGLRIYRITSTNASGVCFEFTWQQIKDFCAKYGLLHVEEYFYGKAKDIYPDIPTDQHWHENVLARLIEDKKFGMGNIMCPYNGNKVPSEGIVLKIDSLFEDKVFKLKNFLFLEKETEQFDKGESNIEDDQASEAE